MAFFATFNSISLFFQFCIYISVMYMILVLNTVLLNYIGMSGFPHSGVSFGPKKALFLKEIVDIQVNLDNAKPKLVTNHT